SPARVFLDIDFSSPSTAREDGLLAAALSRWQPDRMVLPVFVQAASGASGELLLTRPLPQLAAHATLASVNLVPDLDSRIRVIQGSWELDGATIPSVFALLAGTAPLR